MNMEQTQEERLQRIKGGAFLATVAGVAAFVGFSYTVSQAKKKDPKYFNKGKVTRNIRDWFKVENTEELISMNNDRETNGHQPTSWMEMVHEEESLHASAEAADAGVILAMRALGWGTLYAIAGTSCLCYGIWKLSGAKDLKDFRYKMGNVLPVIPKNNPPQSRTEFTGMNDLLTYLAEDYGKNKKSVD